MSQPPIPPLSYPPRGTSSTYPDMIETQPLPTLPPGPYTRHDSFSRPGSGLIQLPPLNIPPNLGRPDYSATPPFQALPPIQTGSSAISTPPRPSSGQVVPLQHILSSEPYYPPRSELARSPYASATSPHSAIDPHHPFRLERPPYEPQRPVKPEALYLPSVESSVRQPGGLNGSPNFSTRHGSTTDTYRGSLSSLGSVPSTASSHPPAPYQEPIPGPPRAVANQVRPPPIQSQNDYIYELRVRQQPIAARACGFGERDRRVIDPPPIIELKITDPTTGKPVAEELKYSLNVVHCTLWSADGQTNQTALEQPDRRTTRRLMGQLVASPSVAKDEHDVEGCFFCFPDLSCRTHGKYRLKFVLMKIMPEQMVVGGYSPIITEVMSEVFTVYTAKDFPGMRPSSALTRALKLQGCNIQVKKGNEKILARKRPSPSDDDDDDGDQNGMNRDKRRRGA